MPTKAPTPRSIRWPSRTAGPASPDPRRRVPASPRVSAIRPDRRCGGRQAQSRHRRGQARRSAAAELRQPPIPLTLRAMRGIPHPGRRSARPVFALLSVLGLLACACFPIAAQAGTVYEPEPTTIPNEPKPNHPKATNNPPDESSEAQSSESPGTGESSGGTGGGSSGGGSSADTGNGGGTGQGNQGNGSQAGNGSQDGQNSPVKVEENKPVSTAPASSDDSSSPLVPILIAIAALAAISIGAVVIRQRRQGHGGPDGAGVSPKAS